MSARLAALALGLALAGCGGGNKPSAPPATAPSGVGNVSAAGGNPGATSDTPTPPPAKTEPEADAPRANAPREKGPMAVARRALDAGKYSAMAEKRAKIDGAWASPLFPLALVRASGATVDQARINKIFAKVKERVCFAAPKLNLADRTKAKKPSDVIALVKKGAETKLEATRTKCGNGQQPLNLSIRIDTLDEIESSDKVKAQRMKPGVVLPPGQKPGPNDMYEYEVDSLKRTMFANGEVSIESRVFPFKVQEMSKDRGNAQLTAGADAVRLKEDPLEVRSSTELNNAITERILAVVQQALDRHMEGMQKAYSTMAQSTATIDDGASQEHHLIEVIAVGGQIDQNPVVVEQLEKRYDMPIAELKEAVAALKLQ